MRKRFKDQLIASTEDYIIEQLERENIPFEITENGFTFKTYDDYRQAEEIISWIVGYDYDRDNKLLSIWLTDSKYNRRFTDEFSMHDIYKKLKNKKEFKQLVTMFKECKSRGGIYNYSDILDWVENYLQTSQNGYKILEYIGSFDWYDFNPTNCKYYELDEIAHDMLSELYSYMK